MEPVDGRNPQREKVRGLSIGRSILVKKPPIAGQPTAILETTLSELMFKKCMEATSFTSRLFATAATIVKDTFGWTPNWLEFLVDNNPQNTVFDG